MKRLLFILTLIAALSSVFTANAESNSLIQQADSAYTADNFKEAADIYNHVIQTEGASATLYYNLGNCYYRSGEMGKAILAYERSLRLDPTYDDARNNLKFVNARISDRPGERGTFIGNAIDSVANAAHSNLWAWLAFGAFVLTIAGILAYIFSGVISVRKVGFFGGIVTLITCGIFIFLACRSAAIAVAEDAAIITVPSTILSTSPRVPKDRNQEAMLLHEGTKVRILDSVKSTTDSINPLWYDVEIDNSHRAWINAAAVEKI
ncbi:MAG: tetratricopeptide repeat protein [Duncaniella sp.]|nr:tetratricopeptide repeat protein [Duncaniella sp.]MDE6117716.1 tetratricopeptide repeat protein [Duncaniella sp.]